MMTRRNLAMTTIALADEMATALNAHGKIGDKGSEAVWAYEIDGFGNALFMDDVNVPSLLGLPYLGAVARMRVCVSSGPCR